MKRIGLYGGGFDPIHVGHLALAVDLFEKKGLDKILFSPSFCSPHKIENPPKASPRHRVEMIRLACHGMDAFEVFEFEAKKEDVSYTIDTLMEVKKSFSGEIFLIMAEDLLPRFDQWKDPEKILENATPLIGSRYGFDLQKIEHLPADWVKKFQSGFVETRLMEASSTEIRARLSKKEFCGHLIPGKVLDYIYSNELY